MPLPDDKDIPHLIGLNYRRAFHDTFIYKFRKREQGQAPYFHLTFQQIKHRTLFQEFLLFVHYCLSPTKPILLTFYSPEIWLLSPYRVLVAAKFGPTDGFSAIIRCINHTYFDFSSAIFFCSVKYIVRASTICSTNDNQIHLKKPQKCTVHSSIV